MINARAGSPCPRVPGAIASSDVSPGNTRNLPAADVRSPPGENVGAHGGGPELPDVAALLAIAVAGIGGAERPGQVAMARAVQHSIETGEHLAVQAGTGTGKSLAYLVPAVRHAVTRHATVVVSTATIALQRQLIDRDLPRLAAALAPALRRAPVFAILKGRRNYLCLQRVRTGAPDDPAEMLFDARGVSATGRQVQRLHDWAGATSTGDRDELVPGVAEQAWRQVSVTARECIGAQRCPFGTRCFAERARAEAGQADVVVTNHALLAIDALEDFDVLPEHDVVIIDEAHDLVDRVTSVAAAELSAAAVEAAARRCGRMTEEKTVGRLREAGEAAERVLAEVPAGRLDVLGETLGTSLAAVRDAASGCTSELRSSAKKTEDDPGQNAARRAALAPLEELQGAADRILGAFGPDVAARPDVVWMERPRADEPSRPPALRVAPLAVGGLLAARLFSRRTVTLTKDSTWDDVFSGISAAIGHDPGGVASGDYVSPDWVELSRYALNVGLLADTVYGSLGSRIFYDPANDDAYAQDASTAASDLSRNLQSLSKSNPPLAGNQWTQALYGALPSKVTVVFPQYVAKLPDPNEIGRAHV